MRSVIEQYCKDLTSGRLTYGYDHCSRVYFYAKKLADFYDDMILHAASFLYKIILGQSSKQDSALRAEAILSEVGYPVEKILIIKDIILNTDPEDRPSSIEGKMIHDAIIIDSLGAIGFARFSVGSFFWHKAQKIQTIYEEYLNYYNNAKNNIILDSTKKLIAERINTTEFILKKIYEELNEE
ncbi:MAG: hypothetical protein N3A58_01425 [Spirochaetes bacterium]|nr:hypothetical protein [Spirochaetota bacterium]